MQLNQIRDFIAIVEAGSIRSAARARGVSHPAMTKSVRLLEDELRVQLFHRGTRGVVPTSAGRVFLERARVIRAEVRKAEQEMAERADQGSATVGVGCVPIVSTMLLPQTITRFLDKHPKSRLRILENTGSVLLPFVRDETIDLAIGSPQPGTSQAGTNYQILCRSRMTVAARKGHPLRGARSIAQLADARWIAPVAPGAGSLIERLFQAQGLALPRQYLQCESTAMAFELIMRTDALALLATSVVASQPRPGALEAIGVAEPLPEMTIGLWTRAETRLSTPAAAFVRILADVAKDVAKLR